MPDQKRLRQREGRQARQEELRRAQQAAKKRRQLIIGAVVVVVLGAAFFFFTRNNGSKKTVSTSTSTTVAGATTLPGATSVAGATTLPGATTVPGTPTTIGTAPAGVACPNADGSSPHYGKFAAYPPTCTDPAKSYTATMQTDAGNIVIALDQKAAPKTVNNFVFLAGYHFYDNTTFHRVVTGFVDQGGDPTASGSGGPGYSFADELPKQVSDYKAGSLAMANSGPNTNGSQFFILVSDAAGQNLGKTAYSLFGTVTSGMDVVQKINADGSTASTGTPTVVHKVLKVTIAAI